MSNLPTDTVSDIQPAEGQAVACFGAGCFWGVQLAFDQTEGVVATEVGYAGGHVQHPSYEQVCGKGTDHAEVVRVVFDPALISFEGLLRVFFSSHKPTELNRQGPDIGTQYRSAVFVFDDTQREQAEAAKAAEDAGGKWNKPVVTEISPHVNYYRAEEYHQKYLQKAGRASCSI